ncbi:branched-chain amino acid transport system substrate-binding protein [Nocardioides zeae]|uniref:Branched-chain amino acid transport system substrate-binding protein n=1 Tax=Nocardioides zeae TaxID=1457234 RepID=A0ACC6IM96_9ACTN|nr:ABC transporter substrate-binding protein [Nocardioides zeae]MDR6173832.1 branched-chain amino acid transport system substrate-binding protein [Nocardioides zeae]MDR6211880.1 branched-chain amino acid transport system substrate-binding protein [Nocardioides zeae]
MKKFAAAALAVASVASLAACGDDSSSGREDGVVRIGLVGPETGAAPQFYTDLLRPVELAVADLADEYGLDVEIVTVDDKGTPDGASAAVQQLLNTEDVDAIFGPPQSGNALQVAEVIQRSGRPWLSAALAPEIMDESLDPNWLFRTNYNASDLSSVVAQYLFSGDSTVGIVHSADAYGQSGAESIEAEAEELGADIAAVEAIQPGTTDFSAGISRLAAAGVDTVFLAITAGADTATVTKAIAQEGLAADRVVTNATILADFATLADPEQWENLVFIDPRDLTGDTVAGIAADYEAEYGEAPIIPTNVYSWMAAVDAYLQAVAEVGDARDFDAVREAMEGLEEVSVRDDVYEKPFGAGDHEIYEPEDPSQWIVFGFDGEGALEARGDLGTCIADGC